MINLDFLKDEFSKNIDLIKITYPEKAKGWIKGIYRPRNKESKIEKIILAKNGLKISIKNWKETGDALNNDKKTCGSYRFSETTHINLNVENANYHVSLKVYNPNFQNLKLQVLVNNIIETNIILPSRSIRILNFNVGLSVSNFDLNFIEQNLRDGKKNADSWDNYIQQLQLSKYEVKREASKLGIFIASDSTAQTYSLSEIPQSGWRAELFHQFKGKNIIIENSSFYPQATRYELGETFIDNRSLGARSSKTFILEGRLEDILKSISVGDYLLIQFGDNDATSYRPNRYVPESKFASYICQYIESVLARKANPILVSPPTQFKFDTDKNKFITTFDSYAQVMRRLSKKYQIPMIELGKEMTDLLNKYGKDAAHIFFLQTLKENYPNLNKSKMDITHFGKYGAYQLAQIIAKRLQQIIGKSRFYFNNYNNDLRPQIDLKLKKLFIQWTRKDDEAFYIIKQIDNFEKYVAATTESKVYINLPSQNSELHYIVEAHSTTGTLLRKKDILI